MRVLVTGGAGFVGSHICDALLQRGHHVTVLDSGAAGVNFTPVGCSGDQKRDLNHLMTPPDEDVLKPNFDAIIHAAAVADVRRNWDSEFEGYRLWRANVDGTRRLLEWAGRIPVVFLSTCAVYGDTDNGKEDDSCIATSPYAASKLAGEALVQAYATRWQLPWHVLRLGCVVGARYHHGHIADFVRMAKEGTIEAASNGRGRKSFIHVKDAADVAAECAEGQFAAGIYNVAADDYEWTPRDTVHMMGDPPCRWPSNTHGWTGDPMAIVNTSKILRTGWCPKRGVREGVRASLRHLGWGE